MPFSALTLLVGWQEGHPACKNWVVGCWHGCLSGARCRLAHCMAQLVPLPLTVSCFSEIQIGLTFLVPAHLGSPGKGPLNGCVCVCACFKCCVNGFPALCHLLPDFFNIVDMQKLQLILTTVYDFINPLMSSGLGCSDHSRWRNTVLLCNSSESCIHHALYAVLINEENSIHGVFDNRQHFTELQRYLNNTCFRICW